MSYCKPTIEKWSVDLTMENIILGKRKKTRKWWKIGDTKSSANVGISAIMKN